MTDFSWEERVSFARTCILHTLRQTGEANMSSAGGPARAAAHQLVREGVAVWFNGIYGPALERAS